MYLIYISIHISAILYCMLYSQIAGLDESKKDIKYLRLPTSLIPTHYLVQLRPHLDVDFTIDGCVRIDIGVLNTTNQLILHTKDIIIHSATVHMVDPPYMVYDISDEKYDVEREFYIILLKQNMSAGSTVALELKFAAHLNDGLDGFYRANYEDENEYVRTAAVTQFQPTNARKAFPCFDEPALKSTFDVILERKDGLVALSNMPVKATYKLSDGWSEVHFRRTVPMSTSVLAFVIGHFGKYPVVKDGLRLSLNIWARHNLLDKAKFAGDIASEGLLFLEDYFSLTYPLPKLDFVAAPEMGPNAMENWGLIIHRETTLLLDPEFKSVTNEKWISYVIAHELVHQWFGNIVTMNWWTDLWLNEGFATYIGKEVIEQLRPSYELMSEFVVDNLQNVMVLDSLKSSLPVRREVRDPQEIKSIFGPITYKKGASIIRMMKHFMGEKAFRKGLTIYLRVLKYGNAKQDDLWKYMSIGAHTSGSFPRNLTINTIMDSWTLQPGFPIIHVKQNGTVLSLTQNRFLQSGEVGNSSQLWWIPISWVTKEAPHFNDTLPKLWMSEKETTAYIKPTPKSDWVILNPQQTGFYRVNYDLENWNKLIVQLHTDHTVIHPINRAQLIDDAFNLAKAGYLNYTTVFSLASYIFREKSSPPWTALVNNLDYIHLMFKKTTSYGAFKKYILSTIQPIYDSIMEDKTNEQSDVQKLKRKMAKWACGLDYQKCVTKAVHLLKEWQSHPYNKSIISGEMASTWFCTAVRAGNSDDWDFLWQRYLHISDANLRTSLLFGLGCSRDVWVLQRYLESALNPDSGLLRQNTPAIFSVVSHTAVGSMVAWNYLKNNWISVRNYMDSAIFALPSVVKVVTEPLNTPIQIEEILKFEQKYRGEFASAEQSVQHAIESTKGNVLWMASNYESITNFLNSNGFSSTLNRNIIYASKEINSQ